MDMDMDMDIDIDMEIDIDIVVVREVLYATLTDTRRRRRVHVTARMGVLSAQDTAVAMVDATLDAELVLTVRASARVGLDVSTVSHPYPLFAPLVSLSVGEVCERV
jgi:hypothetical protein